MLDVIVPELTTAFLGIRYVYTWVGIDTVVGKKESVADALYTGAQAILMSTAAVDGTLRLILMFDRPLQR